MLGMASGNGDLELGEKKEGGYSREGGQEGPA